MGWSGLDIGYMRRAISLAKRALGRTAPNPPVGAVIVKDGEIVGEGYHRKAGEPHAEVNAIRDAGELARGATIYVTLEPCNHTGKTPPCTRAVLEAGISEVVIGCSDPNPRVEGGGAQFLEKMGIKVSKGCLEDECRYLIAPFAKHSSIGRPWVIAKAALSLDGKIATRKGDSQWITNEKARKAGHWIRNQVDAILVGRGTVAADDPQLTCRVRGGRNPLRVVLDSHLSLPPDVKVFDCTEAETVVFTLDRYSESSKAESLRKRGVMVMGSGGPGARVDLEGVLDRLGQMKVQSLLVEGGGEVHGGFFDGGLVDEGVFFIAPMVIGGERAPGAIKGSGVSLLKEAPRLLNPICRRLGDNFMIRGCFTDPATLWR